MEPPERNASALVYIMFENPAELKKSWDASAAGRELNHCLYLPGFHMCSSPNAKVLYPL